MRRPERTARTSPGTLARGLLALLAATAASARADDKVDFDRQVRPILSDNCYACHGPDAKARKADLRLDRKEDALRTREDGAAIVPGKPDDSAIVFRIEADDASVHMPPPESGKSLTPEQAATLRKWVEQGATWGEHWAFVPPTRPEPPTVKDAAWSRNPIDRFILARLEAEGLSHAPEADRATLIRRVTFDLTGLPPTPAEVDAFLNDSRPDAYEQVVARLLRSPRYGEHMARFWLDAARYGDTHGLHLDNYREMWPYRDWVINAFNSNMPFDRFVTEQLAGDLLPDSTVGQKVASGFNRAHVTTSEGGSIAEEVYVRNVVERVDATGTIFLGLTVGCARCHDHKFDPITQKDFYSLFAIFNSLDDNPLDGNAAKYPPIVQVPTAEQSAALAKIDGQIADVRKRIADAVAKTEYDDRADGDAPEFVERSDFTWIDDTLPPNAKPTNKGKAGEPWTLGGLPEQPVHRGAKSAQIRKAEGLQQLVFEGANPALRIGEGDVLYAYVFIDPLDPPKEVMLQWHTDGWKHRAYWGENLIDYGKDGSPERLKVGPLPTNGKWARLEVPAATVGLKPGDRFNGWAFTQHGGTATWDDAGIETYTPQDGQAYDSLAAWVVSRRALKGDGLPEPIKAIVNAERSQRTPEQAKALREYFVEHAWSKSRPTFDPLNAELTKLQAERKATDDAIATTLVSQERKEPKPAFVLDRGEYDKPKDQVGRATPGFLPPMPEGVTPDRLAFARWTLAPEQPLTARVAVNRFWQRCFGMGLVKTSEDFGAQGEPPSHPELLDWLAVEFREGGWDIREFMRLLVTSATYRQSARITPESLAKDPTNRLLARGPRFRLDAEMLRDQALFVGGLLVEHVGGPSVKPPQPAGLWEAVGYTGSNTAKFVADKGIDKVHRRSVYTFWKRTAPAPEMSTFDAPSRETCTVRRERTNTPLQALLLMNDPQFVECARGLAWRTLREAGSSPEERLDHLFRLATARRPVDAERAELLAAYRDHRAKFGADVESAKKLIAVGETAPDPSADPAELAAWTMIANLVLNLDEVINKG